MREATLADWTRQRAKVDEPIGGNVNDLRDSHRRSGTNDEQSTRNDDGRISCLIRISPRKPRLETQSLQALVSLIHPDITVLSHKDENRLSLGGSAGRSRPSTPASCR